MSSGVSASGASQVSPDSGKIKFGKTRMRSNALSSASAKLNSESRCFFIHQVRHIGTADQRAAENHLEADGKTVVAIGVELGLRYVCRYWKISTSRLQILADGGDVRV